jgi:hypothetical protein
MGTRDSVEIDECQFKNAAAPRILALSQEYRHGIIPDRAKELMMRQLPERR